MINDQGERFEIEGIKIYDIIVGSDSNQNNVFFLSPTSRS